MWISKNANDRRHEFIETAIEVFKEKGYESASINDILKRMSITKGAFYYHFDAKEALLDEIVNMHVDEIAAMTVDTAQRSGLTAVEKLRQLNTLVREYRELKQREYQQLYDLQLNKQNAFISARILDRAIALSGPPMRQIIAQGVLEGTFDVTDTAEASELYIRLNTLCRDKILLIQSQVLADNLERFSAPLSDEARRINAFYQSTIERILGAKEGTLTFIIEDERRMIL